MSYRDLKLFAPQENTVAFLHFLRRHNTVEYENKGWLVVRNPKYAESSFTEWLTAWCKVSRQPGTHVFGLFYQGLIDMGKEDWFFAKNDVSNQSLPRRVHIHITPSREYFSDGVFVANNLVMSL